jgi:hypothetical protein
MRASIREPTMPERLIIGISRMKNMMPIPIHVNEADVMPVHLRAISLTEGIPD